MSDNASFAEKVRTLRAIVHSAAEPLAVKHKRAPEFESKFGGEDALELLVDLLRTTNALQVLDETLNGASKGEK